MNDNVLEISRTNCNNFYFIKGGAIYVEMNAEDPVDLYAGYGDFI